MSGFISDITIIPSNLLGKKTSVDYKKLNFLESWSWRHGVPHPGDRGILML
jgi:hypothetical protein